MAHVVRISPQLAPELQVEIARPGNAGYYLADYGWHVPSLLEACDALLDEHGFRVSAKAGISVFDDDFGLHAQQVAPSARSTSAMWPASRCSPRIRSLCRF